jgi:FADH2 O2-dependent halogenase
MNADVIILGSGFAGSLLAAILARQGMRVVLLDRDHHPRFAIGESSTPIADLLLSHLASRWDLPDVAPLARWGTWRKTYPEIGCGLKRGFSYFHHLAGCPFTDTPTHDASLLVAASSTDDEADTHWLRSDVDAFLHRHALRHGVVSREGCVITAIEREAGGWDICWESETGVAERAHGSRIIDATGGGGLLPRALGLCRLDGTLVTQTGALYGHFTGVDSWDRMQQAMGNTSTTTPFRSDDAAQHHIVPGGWVWTLRFANDCCSVGLVAADIGAKELADPATAWQHRLATCPSLERLMAGSRPLRPLTGIPRMSRLWESASGPGWALVPTAAGFVSPLHSTGIAHALYGVTRLAEMLLASTTDEDAWGRYGHDVVDEVHWIDRLVSVATATLDDFPRFILACHLYFVATIACERELVTTIAGGRVSTEGGFLAARNRPLRTALEAAREDLLTPSVGDVCRERVARRLAEWDTAGLFAPTTANRITHSAAVKTI